VCLGGVFLWFVEFSGRIPFLAYKSIWIRNQELVSKRFYDIFGEIVASCWFSELFRRAVLDRLF